MTGSARISGMTTPDETQGYVLVPVSELRYLRDCSDSSMRDGDTAREYVERWLLQAPVPTLTPDEVDALMPLAKPDPLDARYSYSQMRYLASEVQRALAERGGARLSGADLEPPGPG